MNHSTAWNLIPWFVNGRASEQERASLESHFAHCRDCCDEVEGQRHLMLAMQTTPAVESMPHGSLQKLWQRIDADPVKAPVAEPPQRPRLVGLLAAAIAFQALLLGTLSTLLYQSRNQAPTAGEYRTVTASPAPAATPGVRAVFSPALTLGELQALLDEAGLRIAGGPTEDGVYTLAPRAPGNDVRKALRVLRAHPAARFAEPIGP